MPDGSRHNPFHLLNKALRFGPCRVLTRLGAHDFSASPGEWQLARLARLIAVVRSLGEGETRYLMEGLAARLPEPAAAAPETSAGQAAALAELHSLIRAVRVATPERRPIAGQSLYRCYALFAAADLARMDRQETELLAVLHRAFDDAQLRALEAELAAATLEAHPRYFDALLRSALSAAEHARLTARAIGAEPVTGITSAGAKPH